MHRQGVRLLGMGLVVFGVAVSNPVCWCAPQSNLVSLPLMDSGGPSQRLASPAVSRLFGDLAYALVGRTQVTDVHLDYATVFLAAASELDRSNADVQQTLLTLATKYPEKDFSSLIHAWLEYNDAMSDNIKLVKDSIGYLASRLGLPPEREQFLEAVLGRVHGRNVLLDSYLKTELGLLMIEQNNPNASWRYFQEAYKDHLYNKLAFAKLAELLPDQITPEMYFEHLRFVMLENPLDIEAALAFAQYAERLELYSLAVGAYDYCVELYYYLYPGEPLPSYIYMPWAISNYNVKGNLHKVTQIATRVRNSGEFNLFLEALAGRAAHLLGDESAAERIFSEAEEKATVLHSQGPGGEETGPAKQATSQTSVGPKQFAWFYCFARPDKNKAVEWANLAYSSDPESEASESILAYALVLNEQWKWAKPIAEKHDRQIALLALAMIQLNEGSEATAIETLNRSISKDPGSLVAEQAKQLLTRHGSRYKPPTQVTEALTSLAERFGELIVPRFTAPENLVALRFEIPNKTVAYGNEIQGIVTLVNRSDEPLLVGGTALVQGGIRVDAQISGDLQDTYQNVISKTLLADSLIAPGSGLSRPVRLNVGDLDRTLHAHPQANLDIMFRLYLDPVDVDPNMVRNRITSIEPIEVSIKRPAVQISSQTLNQQYNSLAVVDLAQRMGIAELFVGLLKEQQVMAKRGVLYHFKYADWMATRLKSAFTSDSGLLLYRADNEWEAKAQVLVMLCGVDLDTGLTEAVARHLNNPYWPVRLMAMYLLGQTQGKAFADVLDYQAKNETNRLVRDMAQALRRGANAGLSPVYQ